MKSTNELKTTSFWEKHNHTQTQNFINAILLFVAPLPSICFMIWINNNDRQIQCASSNNQASPILIFSCWLATLDPLMLVNALFFINVNVLFCIIAWVQGSTWLIDPYWTILPVLICHFFQFHPAASPLTLRGGLALGMIWVWAIRLTFSYFRREEWSFGVREDWRFWDLRKKLGFHWHYLSFVIVYVAQQAMLVGLSIPCYFVFFSPHWAVPVSALDWIIVFAGILGISIAHVADTQLNTFMTANAQREASGKAPTLIMKSGIWKFSRHPNYFGEQLFWWAFAMFALRLGHPWGLLGTLFNSAVLASVTVMTEARMAAKETRRQAWEEYKSVTSVWLPLPSFTSHKIQQKEE